LTPIAKDIATFYDDVASIDANAELDPHLGWHVGVSGDHATLYRDGAIASREPRLQIPPNSVAGASDDPPAVLFELGDRGARTDVRSTGRAYPPHQHP
jgi:hypothetical protein